MRRLRATYCTKPNKFDQHTGKQDEQPTLGEDRRGSGNRCHTNSLGAGGLASLAAGAALGLLLALASLALAAALALLTLAGLAGAATTTFGGHD